MIGKVGSARRVWITLQTGGGNPRTGVAPSGFTATVINPANSASTTAAVAESVAVDGSYFFDIPAAFTTTHGVGEYGWSVAVITGARSVTGDTVSFFDGDIDGLAADAINDAALAADTDSYQAKTVFLDDDGRGFDRYTTVWYKNGVLITSGITLPLLRVYNAQTGADLVASAAMTVIPTEAGFRFDEATARALDGINYVAEVKATIDGSVRTDEQPVGRDGA